jgi:choline monooxygenase
VWLGDTEDLQEPGDYITGLIGLQPVVVIKQQDGSVQGFLDNCRHRASQITPAGTDRGNCGKSLTCPYHGWAYSTDGSLIGIPDEPRMYPDGIPKDSYGLTPIRVEVAWGKLVFACLSQKAVPFREWVAPLAERYDRIRIDGLKRFDRELDQTYPINWKAFVENSNDDYHVRFVHRRLNTLRHQLDTIVRFEGRTCSGYKPHNLKVANPAGGRDDLPEEERHGHYADFIYPTLTPLSFPTMLVLVKAEPLAPDRTRLVSRVYGLPETSREEQERIVEDNVALTNKEDTDMVINLMYNLRSPFFRVGPPTEWEGRAAHLMKLVRHDVATPLASDEFDRSTS